MPGRPVILNERDPGLYRANTGRAGAHPAMMPDGQRVPITTGEAALPVQETSGMQGTIRGAFNPAQPAGALLVLLIVAVLLHARASVAFATSAGLGRRG